MNGDADIVEPVEVLVNSGEDDSVWADVEEPSWLFGPSCLRVNESWRRGSLATLETRAGVEVSAWTGAGRYEEVGAGEGRYESEMPMAARAKSSPSSSKWSERVLDSLNGGRSWAGSAPEEEEILSGISRPGWLGKGKRGRC